MHVKTTQQFAPFNPFYPEHDDYPEPEPIGRHEATSFNTSTLSSEGMSRDAGVPLHVAPTSRTAHLAWERPGEHHWEFSAQPPLQPPPLCLCVRLCVCDSCSHLLLSKKTLSSTCRALSLHLLSTTVLVQWNLSFSYTD